MSEAIVRPKHFSFGRARHVQKQIVICNPQNHRFIFENQNQFNCTFLFIQQSI